jgi:imidazolonepropionase-like amidohydrolase
MSEAGMSFRQILASLTTAPADRFGESQRLGRIASGFQADIVAFKDDLTAVQYTLRGGQVIYRGSN